MGKSTISMVIFNSYLTNYQAGYMPMDENDQSHGIPRTAENVSGWKKDPVKTAVELGGYHLKKVSDEMTIGVPPKIHQPYGYHGLAKSGVDITSKTWSFSAKVLNWSHLLQRGSVLSMHTLRQVQCKKGAGSNWSAWCLLDVVGDFDTQETNVLCSKHGQWKAILDTL